VFRPDGTIEPVHSCGHDAIAAGVVAAALALADLRDELPGAVVRIASAASGALPASPQRIAAQPSGEITEYTACYSISTRLPMPMASAPPLPLSPVTTAMIGVGSDAMRRRLRAMASA